MYSAFSSVCTPENLMYLLKGAVISLVIAALSLCIGTIFGIIGASAKLSENKVFRFLGNLYVEIIRGTPFLVQLTYIYLAFPLLYMAITGNIIRQNLYVVGLAALSINSGAYTTELIRSGIIGIDKGQFEAGETLGLTKAQTMRMIILPQAFKRIVPPLVSEFITLVKDSSLISTIGAVELMKSAMVLGGVYYDYLSSLTIAAGYYLAMTLCISFFARKLERKLAESD
ncbi:amino acid ABC transporter permease [Tannockella kyphosi]|uniref:amino acid ABC transporter permease n=1 Tax=Tannockella kyphosi TaxID=2899121 RepID=UPI00201111DB|nr:amino acid ABC transporter permease [Tannockella kyphosi]